MNAAAKREQQFTLYFRSKAEKEETIEFATNVRDFNSLNAYVMHLIRQDRRNNAKSSTAGGPPVGEQAALPSANRP